MKTNCTLSILLLLTCCLYCSKVSAQLSAEKNFQRLVENEKQAFGSFSGQTADGVAGGFATNASTNFDVNFYRCEWTVDPAIRYIQGKVSSYFTITTSTDKIVYDLSDTLTVDSVVYHGVPIIFQWISKDALQLQFPSSLPVGRQDSVSIYYKGVPRLKTGFQAFVVTSHSGVPVMQTLSEPYGAKEWWPCKNGLDDKADSVNIIITSPSAYRGTTNGILYNDEVVGASRIVSFKHRHPIASYLVCMAVTNYDVSVDSVLVGSKMMPVVANAYPEDKIAFAEATFYAKQTIQKFNTLFGDYPFADELYSQTEWNSGGGMEHQTNSFIGSTWNQLVAHELGHHWFGDWITCGSWQHIWLNEGFGNYMQFLYVENFDTALHFPHLKYYLNLVVSAPDGSVFVPDTSSESRIFSGRLTYAKGGYVLHMLRGMLGDSVFFRGLRQYQSDPLVRHSFALTADLQRNMESVSGKNLQSFFQKWIYGEGYPNYNASWSQNTNGWIKVKINQTTSHPSVSFYEMPVQLEFRNSTRDTIITVSHQLNGQEFWINPGFQADTMLIDPNYWILAKDRNVQKVPLPSLIADDIRIYPNPAPNNLYVTIYNPASSSIQVRLYSVNGQLMYSVKKELNGTDETITIPTTQLAAGNYVLKIVTSKNTQVSKVILK